MLIRLSLQNAKKTFSDYAIYVLTVSMMIALDCMLNRLIFSREISEFTESSSGMKIMLAFSSVVMLVVVFALINYMTKFILIRRSKEFGLYQLMGIESNRIKYIYWIEQCYIGVISLFIGILSGLLFGEILRSVLFNYIGCIDYNITVDGVGTTVILTAIEAVTVYLAVRLSGRKLFKSKSIINWIQTEKKNEKVKENGKARYVLTVFWLITSITTFIVLFNRLNNITYMLVVSCVSVLLISIFGFTTCFVRIINDVLLSENKQFTMRVLPVRFLSKKIATKSKQMGILSMIFVVAMCLISTGFLFGNYIREYGKEYSGLDFYYTPDIEDNITPQFITGLEHVLMDTGIDEKYVIKGFEVENCNVPHIYEDEKNTETVVALSTYNHFRQMLGKKSVRLEDDEFIVQTHIQQRKAEDVFTKKEYNILGQDLKLKSLEITALNTQCIANGSSYYFVIPDELLSDIAPAYYSYAYKLPKQDFNKLEKDILKYVISNSKNVDNVLCFYDTESNTKDQQTCLSSNFCFTETRVQESAYSFAAISISLLFIGLVFALVLSTILAVLLTSEINENKLRFLTLNRLGVSLKKQEEVLLKQIISLFSIPVLIGFPLTVTVSVIICRLFKDVMTNTYMLSNISLSIVGFLVIYILYMIVTYRTLCKSITCE